ncbi:MAG: tetraprenyl-beta-curcumene synthase family protein [Dethiobacter sp.]|jgi:tetraprenyl-beta-curcumene synthase|nr:MAG: tetraprenyl-beta-curcumene synthase family protein [Dethiobacter sp.]
MQIKLQGVGHILKTRQFHQWSLIARYLFDILPRVEKELQGWKSFLRGCPPSPLQQQALHSIRDKRFHCQGGAVFALLNPAACQNLLPLIVSFQTISDYLDNLCDRITWEHISSLRDKEKDLFMEKGFRQLHDSMLASLETGNLLHQDFYQYYPLRADEGYLQGLVNCCQKNAAALPALNKVNAKVLFLTGLYCDLQSLKHLSLKYRQKRLEKWFQAYQKEFSCLLWHEFAAAAGSTLGTFVLLAMASQQNVSHDEIEKIFNCYFPWICCLHILLDYFIDQEEDRREEDLNFVSYYSSREHCCERLFFFIENSLQRAGELSDSTFHRTVVKSLLALYFSDPKIKRQKLEKTARDLLSATGEKDIFFMYHLCRLLRKSSLL